MQKLTLSLTVNGVSHKVSAHPCARLLDVLREDLKLTGTKEGCGEGECGACSVLMDGELVNSCLVPFGQADGIDIQTIEGLKPKNSGALHAIQRAFLECGGAQCGICTPGMILAAKKILDHTLTPTESDMRTGLAGNICRCTGYTRIFTSVARAAELLRGES